jgi:murein DD-endopeptidase MepM/ murein hydrolase activator NlpD
MIFCPLPGTPLITQGFGQNPQVYSQFGYQGHNGLDFGVPEGTTVYAPHDGTVTVKDTGTQGYGKHVIIQDGRRYSLLGHLSSVSARDGQSIAQGDPIGQSGMTGMCTGPHVHWTFKLLSNGTVQNKDNGYDGAIDVAQFTRLWQDQDLYHDAQFTADAALYKTLTLASNQQLQNPFRNVA